MKCPACFNELTQLQVGAVLLDVCYGGCGGIWFDAFELQRVDDLQDPAGESLLDIPRSPQVVVDPVRKRDCPRCAGIKLYRHFFSAKRRVQVDQCPNCAGYWLDAGELAVIRAEKTAAEELGQAGRSVTSREVIRYLYELHLEILEESPPG